MCPPVYSSVCKTVTTYPRPPQAHTFLKRRFLTDFEKHTHKPPKVATFWCIRPKVEKSLKKCEFAPCWQETDVPERYAMPIMKSKWEAHSKQQTKIHQKQTLTTSLWLCTFMDKTDAAPVERSLGGCRYCFWPIGLHKKHKGK